MRRAQGVHRVGDVTDKGEWQVRNPLRLAFEAREGYSGCQWGTRGAATRESTPAMRGVEGVPE